MMICRWLKSWAAGFLKFSAFTATFVVLAGGPLVVPGSSNARTMYVKPTAEVVVRTGQGNQYKIIGLVKDGDSIDLVEEGEDYAKVRLENGSEGWMLKRYLSEEPPLQEIVVTLRQEKEELKRREMNSQQEFNELSAELSRAKTQLDGLVEERDRIQQEYTVLQEETADVVQIKDNLQKTAEENQQLAERLARIEQENAALKKDTAINWFLAGAGVLLAGMILGRLPRPSRRRKSSLLS